MQINNDKQWTSSLGWSEHEERTESPGIESAELSGIPASSIQSLYRKLEGESYLSWEPTANWALLSGVSARRAHGENRGTLDYGFPLPVAYTLKQQTYGLFAESSLQLGALSLGTGLRYDAPARFGNEVSKRIALDYAFNEDLQIFGSWGEGYKLPSFFALAHPLIGNPSLKPERSTNSEVGIRSGSSAGNKMQLRVFHNRYRDLVDFDAQQFLSVNRSKVVASGAEWQGTLQLIAGIEIDVDITYLDTDIKNSDDGLRRRPKWSGGLHLHARLREVELTITADSRSEFLDSSIATGPITLAGYTELSLAAQWQLTPKTNLTINIDNLADREFETSVGFINSGRQLRVGVRHQLQ